MPGYVVREYPVMEIAIALWTMVRERVQEGDIVEARRPDIGIGLKEAKSFLWMLVDGEEFWEYMNLKESVYEPYQEDGDYDTSATKYDKFRYNIPLSRLEGEIPTLDLDKLRDQNDPYQPFYTIDEDTGLWLTEVHTPFEVKGLIFDKVTGVYL